MRLTTDFWASALVRRVFGSGGYAAVLRRGADSAGALFLIVRSRDGTSSLFGPAPQQVYDEAKPDERIFTHLQSGLMPGEEEARMEREIRFDPDLWMIEIEPGGVAIEELIVVAKA